MRHQRRVSIEMEKSRAENTENMSHYKHLWQSDEMVKKTQVKSVRCARTTRRIRYALVGPEIQALN